MPCAVSSDNINCGVHAIDSLYTIGDGKDFLSLTHTGWTESNYI